MAIPRLPIPGEDENQWGDLLNAFLSVEHNANGTLKKASDITTALSMAQAAQTAADSAAPAGGAIAITRDGSGNVTAVTQGSLTIDQISRTNGLVTSYRENGTTRNITRDSAGRVTAVV